MRKRITKTTLEYSTDKKIIKKEKLKPVKLKQPIMKNLTFFLLLFTITAQAQITPFAKVSIDPMMAIQGPHKGDDRFAEHSLDIEFQGGLEITDAHLRVSMAFQTHNEINYTKWTLLMVDFMLLDFPLNKINCYVGTEVSTIYRRFDNIDYTDPNNYLEREESPMRIGLNAEIQWMPFKNIGLSSHINYFQAEHELSQYGDKSRWEVMVGVVFKLNEIKIDW